MKKFVLFFLVVATALLINGQKTETFNPLNRPKDLSDSALLDLVQKQTFRYFWDFAHPVSGLSRERSNQSFGYGNEVVTIGGTGFGVMSISVAAERKWITRAPATKFTSTIVNFPFTAYYSPGVFLPPKAGGTRK